jgi:trigger factor
MKTELVDVNETRRNLVVEIPSEVVDAEIDSVTSRYGRSAKLPGFRPGKVPAKVVRQRFRSQIMHDVAHELVERVVGSALTERGVEPVDTPHIHDLKLEEGHPLTFTAEFDIVPSFDPGDLTSISARRPPVTIDEEAIDQTLGRLRERAARFEPVEGTSDDGHTVVVDIERQGTKKDGTRGEKEKLERVPVEIGATANPPGLDAELKGLSSGVAKTFTLRYPDDYGVTELAGAEVAYAITVHDVRRRILPELDDEFAKDLGEFETLDALRARVRQDLEAESREASDRGMRAEVLKHLASRVPFAVPAALIDREVDRRVEDFARRLFDQGIDPRQTNIDWAQFREGQREPATEAVASALVLDEIGRREEIAATEGDIDAEVERYARQLQLAPADVRARLERDGSLGRLALGVRREKAMARVLEQVKVINV